MTNPPVKQRGASPRPANSPYQPLKIQSEPEMLRPALYVASVRPNGDPSPTAIRVLAESEAFD